MVSLVKSQCALAESSSMAGRGSPMVREQDAAGDLQGYNHRVARTIARRSTANYLISIHQDSEFAGRARALRPQWPLLANLRAGAWYVNPKDLDGTCYFKSVDGHRNAWDFSLIRLNLQVAQLAAGCGGLCLVDCTGNRRKRFPDSMSKTVPIWCAVLQAAMQEATSFDAFDELLHLPSMVQDERPEILQRLPGFTERLRQALPWSERNNLAAALNGKKLRSFWVCPSDDLQKICEELLAWQTEWVIILCISASKVEMGSTTYVQGAGDDEEVPGLGSALGFDPIALLEACMDLSGRLGVHWQCTPWDHGRRVDFSQQKDLAGGMPSCAHESSFFKAFLGFPT
ncbi:unnamed protein product [Durusdinium trenchii]|uniref:Rit1 N-terminal domain-containing protein n=1 Tax=Durusdinium trenchii TaxID=1381693 RepID=A0ABP0RL11_9DINO